MDAGYINPDSMKQLEPKIEEVLVSQLPKPIVFSLVIKEKNRDTTNINNIILAVKELKRIMIEGKIETARIARVRDGLDFPWISIEKVLREHFDCNRYHYLFMRVTNTTRRNS